MRNSLNKKVDDSGESGFTLIELLIVIVILGILAGIVVFAVGSASSDSKLSACKADKKTVGVALEAYKAKTGAYPAAASTDLVPNYVKTFPGGADYAFTVATLTSTVTVSAGTNSGPPVGC